MRQRLFTVERVAGLTLGSQVALDSAMDPEPEIVVHAPLPEPKDEGVTYEAEGESDGDETEPDPGRKVVPPLDPDQYQVLLRTPFKIYDDHERALLAEAINQKGARRLHVGLGESAPLNSELLTGLRRLGAESGVSRIDVHVHHDA